MSINSKILIYSTYLIVLIFTILLCSGTFLLAPTADDWDYLTSPFIDSWHFSHMLPLNYYWRPIDALVGLILSDFPHLFPAFNHFLIVLGFLTTGFFLYKITNELNFKKHICYILLCLFFVSPAMLGTVLGIDSINQCFATMWGTIAIYSYICKNKYLWILASILSIFSKENGIVYFILPPVLAYAFELINKKQLIKNIIIGSVIIVLYFITRHILTIIPVSIDSESPYAFSIIRKLTDILAFVGGTTTAIDFISLIHPESRNYFISFITLLFSLPLLFVLFFSTPKRLFKKKNVLIAVCIVIAAAPHLATHFGPMHAYSTIVIYLLLIGTIINDNNIQEKKIALSLLLFVLSAIFVDIHHYYRTYNSANIGPVMAKAAYDKTKNKNNHYVLGISITDSTHRYSSFCVPPREVFKYGQAVRKHTNYTFPKHLLRVRTNNRNKVDSIIKSHPEYKTVWVQYKENVDVINF